MYKTTIELPEQLSLRLKQVLLDRHVTLKDFIARAVSNEINGAYAPKPKKSKSKLVFDEDGFPCYPSRGVVVTNEMINKIREEEGI